MHSLLKKTPPSHFTLTQVQLLVLVSAAGILAVPNWWVTALSLQSQLGCSCCWHRLTALSQGWKGGTTATRSSHPYIIFAHCQRHVCTFLALELLGHKVKYPLHPQHRPLLCLVQQFKSQYLTLPLQFFPISACSQWSLSPAVSMMIYRTIKSDAAVTGPSENYPPSQ